MKKVTIKTPATSANLGVGFDTMGLALNIFNEYSFEESSEYELKGFSKDHLENNLVLSSYKRLFKELDKEEIKVKITELKADIPIARGLGSSASCIVSGLLGANFMLGNILGIDEIIDLATLIEGHPDNVVPCLLGGLVTSFNNLGEVFFTKYKVSKNLFFTLLVPNFELETKVARSSLPKDVSLSEMVDNMSKAANLPVIFSSGNFYALKAATRNAFHEKYRYPLIKGAEKIRYEIEDENHIVLISGSGPSLIVISSENDEVSFESKDYKIIKTSINMKGTRIK